MTWDAVSLSGSELRRQPACCQDRLVVGGNKAQQSEVLWLQAVH